MSDLAKRRAYIEQLWIVSRHRAEWLRSTSAAPAPLNLEICCHDVVWAYDDDNLAETAKSIEASDTDCANYIIYDLDETRLAPDQQLHRERAGYLRKVREGHRSRPGDRLATSRRPQGAFPR